MGHFLQYPLIRISSPSYLSLRRSRQTYWSWRKVGPLLLREFQVSLSRFVHDKGCSQEHPLALLHVRFRKCDTSEPRPTFYCPCHSFQRFSAQLTGPATTAKPSRRCLHFYICLWAFASKSCLAQEFSFLTMNHESDGPSLSAGMYAYASMVILLDKKIYFEVLMVTWYFSLHSRQSPNCH